MTSQASLSAHIRTGHEHHEEVVRLAITPLVKRLSSHPSLAAAHFGRYSIPEWEVRLDVIGEAAWVRGEAREAIEREAEPLVRRGIAGELAFSPCEREVARHGGEEGMRLSERIYGLDSIACLDFMEAEREGLTGSSRREFSLILTDRLLDLLRFDGARRREFYKYAWSWALEAGTFRPQDLAALEQKYAGLREDLEETFAGPRGTDPVRIWRGEAAARIAGSYLEAAGPIIGDLLSGVAAGRVRQDPIHLAWSYGHMQCNRLGIAPAAEAILRWLMDRFLAGRSEEA